MKKTLQPSSRPTAQYLVDRFPLMHQGQYDNLYYDDGRVRVWLSRLEVADGAPYDNMVTIEELTDGKWLTVAEYDGGKVNED